MAIINLGAAPALVEDEEENKVPVAGVVHLGKAPPLISEPPPVLSTKDAPQPEETPPPIHPETKFEQTVKLKTGNEVRPDLLKSPYGIGDAGLSIASSLVGALGGSIAAAGSATYNLVDIATKPFISKWQGGYYGPADTNMLRDLEALPDRMTAAYNVVAKALTWEPRTEDGNRWVENLGKSMEEIRNELGTELAKPYHDFRELLKLSTGLALSDIPEKAIYASGNAALDMGLVLAGGRLASAPVKPTKLDGTVLLPTGEVNPVSGIQSAKININALTALPGSKPKFASPEAMQQRINDIAQGKIKNEIVVETTQGLPTRVISGQDTLMVLRGMESKGAKVREVKVRTIEREVLPTDEASAAKVGAAFKADDTAMEALKNRAREGAVQAFIRNFIDVSGNTKNALEKLGPAGHKAVEQLVLRAGATPRAQQLLNDAWYKIYDGLSTSNGTGATIAGELISNERALFDRFAISQRIVAIEGTKIGKARKPQFHGGTSGYDHAAWLNSAKAALGNERFAEYALRAEHLFDVGAAQLKALYDNGLITALDYRRLRGVNYLTTRYLEHIDPQIPYKEIGGQTITVGESGLHPFKGGSKKAQLTDTESILREYVVRTQNRIARNNANKALFQVAKQQPKNGVVREAKYDAKGNPKDAPPGETLIRVRIDGETKGMYMPEWLADGWVVSSPEISTTMANWSRALSGSVITRPLATGYNPAFAIANMPMDLIHIFLAQSGDYSSFLPMYLMQYGRDILTVAKDAARKTGRYKDYINEGGWFDFLTHQGQQVINLSGGARYIQRHQPKLKLIRDSLGYFNQWSEVVSRLAHRERVLRNQQARGEAPDPVAATFAARNRLDFHQGGGVTKGFDNIIPYLNANTQVMRKVLGNAKQHPVETSYKMLQLAAIPTAWAAYNMLVNAEVITQIPMQERMRNYIFVPPGHPFYIDKDGTKKFVYYTLRKEPFSATFYNWLELTTYKYMGEKPTYSAVDYIVQHTPVSLTNIPTLQAYMSYVSDYNFWFGDDVYGRDSNVDDYAKFTGDTPEIYKNFGELFGKSPEGLRAATRALIPNNAYVEAGTLMYDNVFADPAEQEEMPWGEMMADMPLASRVYKLTNPYQVLMERADYLPKVTNTAQKLAYFELDKRMAQDTPNKYQNAYDYAESFSESDVFLYKDMVNRVSGHEVLDEFFNKETPAVLNLPRGWWLGLVQESSGRRAELFFDNWRDGNAKEREKMEDMAGSLNAAGLQFLDQEFLFRFEQLQSEYNTTHLTIEPE